jgi:hypothetical protein
MTQIGDLSERMADRMSDKMADEWRISRFILIDTFTKLSALEGDCCTFDKESVAIRNN